MRKRIIRICSFFLVSLMLISLLAACDSSNTSDNSDNAASSSDNGSEDSNQTPPTELTVEVFDRATPGQTPVDNNYWTKWIQDNFGTPNNINVKFVPCPRSEEVQRLNLWMASGTAPDISFTYDLPVVYNFYQQGGLADLTDALNQHGSDLKTYLGEEILSYGKFDDKQYAIPAKRIITAMAGTFVREDWLKKLNSQTPSTIDEFTNMLKAFKTQNPGNVKNVIPYTLTSDVGYTASNLFEAFIKQPVSDKDRYIYSSASGQGLFLPGFKDGVKYLNKLYNEGMLSPNFALDKDGKLLEQAAINGTLGAYGSNYDHPIRNIPGINMNLAKNVPGARFIPIDPFANLYTGETLKQRYAPNGLYNIVPKSSEHVNEAIKYLNWMTDKDVLFFLQYGNEGIGHKMVNGIPQVLTPTGEQMFDSLQNIDYTLIVNGADLGDEELNMKAQALTYPGGEDLYPACYELAMKNSFPPVQLSKPTNADVKYDATLAEKEKELYAKCITCKPADFDSMWDTMTKEYLQAGGQQIIDERKALWDEEHK